MGVRSQAPWQCKYGVLRVFLGLGSVAPAERAPRRAGGRDAAEVVAEPWAALHLRHYVMQASIMRRFRTGGSIACTQIKPELTCTTSLGLSRCFLASSELRACKHQLLNAACAPTGQSNAQHMQAPRSCPTLKAPKRHAPPPNLVAGTPDAQPTHSKPSTVKALPLVTVQRTGAGGLPGAWVRWFAAPGYAWLATGRQSSARWSHALRVLAGVHVFMYD